MWLCGSFSSCARVVARFYFFCVNKKSLITDPPFPFFCVPSSIHWLVRQCVRTLPSRGELASWPPTFFYAERKTTTRSVSHKFTFLSTPAVFSIRHCLPIHRSAQKNTRQIRVSTRRLIGNPIAPWPCGGLPSSPASRVRVPP